MIFSIVILTIGIFISLFYLKRVTHWGDELFTTLALITYTVMYVVSGWVHSVYGGPELGYFYIKDTVDLSYVSLVVLFGLVALIVGLKLKPSSTISFEAGTLRVDSTILNKERSRLLIVGLSLFVLGIYGLYQLFDLVELVLGVRRLSYGEGNARFYFMAQWASISMVFIVIGVKAYQQEKASMDLWLLIFATLLIVLFTLPFGGRINMVQMVAALWILVIPYLAVKRAHVIGVFVPLMLVLVLFMTILRYSIYDNHSIELTSIVIDMLDWNYGRYSMIGYAHDYTMENGLEAGRLLFADLSQLFSQLLGIQSKSDIYNIDYIATTDLEGYRVVLYVSTGFGAQVYMDSGAVGFVLYWFLYGFSINRLQLITYSTANLYLKIALSYLLLFMVVSWPLIKFGGVFQRLMILSPIFLLAFGSTFISNLTNRMKYGYQTKV